MKYFVEIVEIKTQKVERRLPYDNSRLAEKAELGVLRHLNTDEFFVRTVTE